MDVVDCLTAIRADVDDGAVSLREAFGAGDLGGDPLQMTEQLSVLFSGLSEGANVFSRNDKNVHWRLRLDVGERVAVFILVDGPGGYGSIDDLAKDATHYEKSIWVRLRWSEYFPRTG
jgi:hypothetical protein